MSFKVYSYTKDERWVKSGVKMGCFVDEYSVISVFYFVWPIWRCFSFVSSCSVVSWMALREWEMRVAGH